MTNNRLPSISGETIEARISIVFSVESAKVDAQTYIDLYNTPSVSVPYLHTPGADPVVLIFANINGTAVLDESTLPDTTSNASAPALRGIYAQEAAPDIPSVFSVSSHSDFGPTVPLSAVFPEAAPISASHSGPTDRPPTVPLSAVFPETAPISSSHFAQNDRPPTVPLASVFGSAVGQALEINQAEATSRQAASLATRPLEESNNAPEHYASQNAVSELMRPEGGSRASPAPSLDDWL